MILSSMELKNEAFLKNVESWFTYIKIYKKVVQINHSIDPVLFCELIDLIHKSDWFVQSPAHYLTVCWRES